MASPASQASNSRRRGGSTGTNKEATTEDQALNMIAREAEARLAAKRAARAEARSIRMKEIERKQKESEDADIPIEDNEPPDENIRMRRTARLSSPTIPSFDIPDTIVPSVQATSDDQNQKLKDQLKESEVKYKKAMVSAAQYDNERQALQYHVEVLKDVIEELQQKIENTDDELTHKCKEYNKLNREYNNTVADFDKCRFLLQDRERVLDENGINLDGSIKEGYTAHTASLRCSLCSASLDDDVDIDHREVGSLLAEISSLKCAIEDMKQTSNSVRSRRDIDSGKNDRVELEQSFADVSNEAAVIRQDALHTGFYINNNEKNDDFELIDDGSQQGGIRHFEDQSFEKSTSSLASSMLTEGTSIESSVPLEISVSGIARATQKDDYDIVQVEDNIRTSNININKNTRLEYVPSISSSSGSGGEPSSNININKYLFHDHDDTLNDENEQYNGFSVDRYFAATESVSYNGHSNNAENEDDHVHIEENNELQTSVDTITNVQSDYDTIDTEDVIFNAESHFASEENRNSPYEDLQAESVAISRPSEGIVIIEESKASDKISFDETSVESSDIRLLKDASLTSRSEESPLVIQTDLDLDADEEARDINVNINIIEKEVIPTENSSLHMAPALDLSVSDVRTDYDIIKNSNETVTVSTGYFGVSEPKHVGERSVETMVIEGKASFETNDHVSDEDFSMNISSNSSVKLNSDSPLNKAFCSDNSPPLQRDESISETDKIAIRKDFEELYNQIAGETNESVATYDEPAPGGDMLSEDGDKRGWLVQVESFSTPAAEAPEIRIVDVNPEKPAPEPKERKKKKKKKKVEKSEESNAHVQEMPQCTVVPSDPLLLGFASEPDRVSNSSEKSSEKTSRPTSDIPKQFLDASAELIDNSYSDVSENEDEEVGEDGKKKSREKSRSRKEGCKSQ